MKRNTTVGTVVGALGCLGFLAAGQGVMHLGSSQAPPTHWMGKTQTNAFVVPFAGSHWLFQAVSPGRKTGFKVQPLPPSARPGSTSAPPPVPPGVYRTIPYSCIVVVPGPHPDDRCIVKPPDVDSSMPAIKPELQFIPWGLAAKNPVFRPGVTNR